jgi:hypothetical protein
MYCRCGEFEYLASRPCLERRALEKKLASAWLLLLIINLLDNVSDNVLNNVTNNVLGNLFYTRAQCRITR